MEKTVALLPSVWRKTLPEETAGLDSLRRSIVSATSCFLSARLGLLFGRRGGNCSFWPLPEDRTQCSLRKSWDCCPPRESWQIGTCQYQLWIKGSSQICLYAGVSETEGPEPGVRPASLHHPLRAVSTAGGPGWPPASPKVWLDGPVFKQRLGGGAYELMWWHLGEQPLTNKIRGRASIWNYTEPSN